MRKSVDYATCYLFKSWKYNECDSRDVNKQLKRI